MLIQWNHGPAAFKPKHVYAGMGVLRGLHTVTTANVSSPFTSGPYAFRSHHVAYTARAHSKTHTATGVS